MADQVQRRLESMLGDLQKWRSKQLFTADEVREIVRRRTKHEYKVASKAPSILDYLRYLAYETNLYHKLTQRTQGMKSDRRKVHGMQTKRLHTLYQRTLFKYPTDLKLITQYLDFCRKTHAKKGASEIMGRSLSLNPTDDRLWVLAANWYYEGDKDIRSARALLQRAIRVLPFSQRIWVQYFRLELLYREQVIQRLEILLDKEEEEDEGEEGDNEGGSLPFKINGVKGGEEEDEEEAGDDPLREVKEQAKRIKESGLDSRNNPFLKGVIMKIILKEATAKWKDNGGGPELLLSFIAVYRDFTDTKELRKEAYEHLIALYPDSCDALVSYCEREWREDFGGSDSDKYEAVMEDYERTVGEGGDGVWGGVVGFLGDRLNDKKPPVPKGQIYSSLLDVFEKSREKNCLSPSLYLSWANYLFAAGEQKKGEEVLLEGAEKYHSSPLWEKLLDFAQLSGDYKKVEKMYERGIRSLGFNGQNLFLYYLRHCALIGKSGDEVNKAIHSALSHMFSVNSVSSSPFSSSSSTLPTSSLPTSKGEWEEGLVQALGVVRVGWGKEVAKNFCSLVLSLPWSPSSLFHFSRVEMCVQQEGLELVGGEGEGGEGEVREAFEEGVRGGGGEEGIFWFAYYDWERSRGNHENAGKIHRRALKSLSDPSEFVEMHAQSTLMD